VLRSLIKQFALVSGNRETHNSPIKKGFSLLADGKQILSIKMQKAKSERVKSEAK